MAANINITAAQVIAKAYVNQNLRTEWITANHIKLALLNYMKPQLSGLYDLCIATTPSATIQTLCTNYLLDPLAFYVKYQALPDMFVQMSNVGAMQMNEQYSTSSSTADRNVLRNQALNDANALMRVAIEHIEDNADLYPEYTRCENVTNRIKNMGGIIFPKTKIKYNNL